MHQNSLMMTFNDNVIIGTQTINEEDIEFIVCHQSISFNEYIFKRYQLVMMCFVNIIYLSWIYNNEYRSLIDIINDMLSNNIRL